MNANMHKDKKEKLLEALKAALSNDEELSKVTESWKVLDDAIFDGAKLWDLKDLIAYGEGEENDEEDNSEDEDCDECDEVTESCEAMRLECKGTDKIDMKT